MQRLDGLDNYISRNVARRRPMHLMLASEGPLPSFLLPPAPGEPSLLPPRTLVGLEAYLGLGVIRRLASRVPRTQSAHFNHLAGFCARSNVQVRLVPDAKRAELGRVAFCGHFDAKRESFPDGVWQPTAGGDFAVYAEDSAEHTAVVTSQRLREIPSADFYYYNDPSPEDRGSDDSTVRLLQAVAMAVHNQEWPAFRAQHGL